MKTNGVNKNSNIDKYQNILEKASKSLNNKGGDKNIQKNITSDNAKTKLKEYVRNYGDIEGSKKFLNDVNDYTIQKSKVNNSKNENSDTLNKNTSSKIMTSSNDIETNAKHTSKHPKIQTNADYDLFDPSSEDYSDNLRYLSSASNVSITNIQNNFNFNETNNINETNNLNSTNSIPALSQALNNIQSNFNVLYVVVVNSPQDLGNILNSLLTTLGAGNANTSTISSIGVANLNSTDLTNSLSSLLQTSAVSTSNTNTIEQMTNALMPQSTLTSSASTSGVSNNNYETLNLNEWNSLINRINNDLTTCQTEGGHYGNEWGKESFYEFTNKLGTKNYSSEDKQTLLSKVKINDLANYALKGKYYNAFSLGKISQNSGNTNYDTFNENEWSSLINDVKRDINICQSQGGYPGCEWGQETFNKFNTLLKTKNYSQEDRDKLFSMSQIDELAKYAMKENYYNAYTAGRALS